MCTILVDKGGWRVHFVTNKDTMNTDYGGYYIFISCVYTVHTFIIVEGVQNRKRINTKELVVRVIGGCRKLYGGCTHFVYVSITNFYSTENITEYNENPPSCLLNNYNRISLSLFLFYSSIWALKKI